MLAEAPPAVLSGHRTPRCKLAGLPRCSGGRSSSARFLSLPDEARSDRLTAPARLSQEGLLGLPTAFCHLFAFTKVSKACVVLS